MKNDLEKYEQIIHQDSPAMTWSWFAIGFKWVGNEQKKQTYFTRSYSNYMVSPFKVGGHHSRILALNVMDDPLFLSASFA